MSDLLEPPPENTTDTTLQDETEEFIKDAQPILTELSKRVHYLCTRNFVRREIETHFEGFKELLTTGPVTLEGLKYHIRLIYVRLLTDLDWVPPPGSLILVGSNIESVKEYARCETCRLPAGVWCFPALNV